MFEFKNPDPGPAELERDVLEIQSLPDYQVPSFDTLTPSQLIPYPTSYLFGFVVDMDWMMDYGERLIASGRGTPGPNTLDCADSWIRTHCRYVNVNVLYPRKGKKVWCYWIGASAVEWTMAFGNNPEIQQKLKDAFSTDTEPKWYPLRRLTR
ncbi:hypothetical protein QCA50_019876 [Cerrena zonata]|uniref:Uncharacterized protein n=1 Tax=Cerrena zonata TaxID=2478898 RepID=A0AAW0FBF5_9APHY